ncbi:hypothetical protein [Sphingobacterium daejeonense]|uniref:hypothetical protein n=1 Tax=Sphingobacterium daejeonense TaxID=371142 RepID=UPI0010C2656D|nr:hypothetical protein [Sphingobacterium daejeonense]VTQ00436.1 Uncharacterised protein [Sphingobacterium daejeonense]
MNFDQIIDQLKKTRPIFHSEDDLKLAMSWLIKELYPSYEIRLERPIGIGMKTKGSDDIIARAPIDILVIDRGSSVIYPIEIKYKTKTAKIKLNGENYSLANHGANDVGRYSFRKDIYRIEIVDLEQMGFKDFTKIGFVFILTNDRKYYLNDVSAKNSLDAHFSFHHGAVLSKDYIGWNLDKISKDKYDFGLQVPVGASKKKHWTEGKEYVYQLGLKRDYLIQWRDFSTFAMDKGKVEEFKFCLIAIEG